MSQFYASLLEQIKSNSPRDLRRRRIHLTTLYLSSRLLLAATSSEDELWAHVAAHAKKKMLSIETLSDCSSDDDESYSSNGSSTENEEDPRKFLVKHTKPSKASSHSLHLCAKMMLSHESYIRDAIADAGLRWNNDYCLAQNLYRFKAKLMLGCKEIFWRWNSWDGMARRSNAYLMELEAGIASVKRTISNWRATSEEMESNADQIRYYWHNGEYAPYAAPAVGSIERLRRILDRKYPVHWRYRDASSKTIEWNGAGVMSRSVFRQRDRALFALLHDFLVEPVKTPNGEVVPLPHLEFQHKIRELARGSDGHPCLVYAATKILLASKDVGSTCVVPRNLPGMWQGCCAQERVPWFSELHH